MFPWCSDSDKCLLWSIKLANIWNLSKPSFYSVFLRVTHALEFLRIQAYWSILQIWLAPEGYWKQVVSVLCNMNSSVVIWSVLASFSCRLSWNLLIIILSIHYSIVLSFQEKINWIELNWIVVIMEIIIYCEYLGFSYRDNSVEKLGF